MCTNLSNCVICYLIFPETKNKTLEEIGLLFGDTNVRTMPSHTADIGTNNESALEKGGHLDGERSHLEYGKGRDVV